jgi:hypothetical protein
MPNVIWRNALRTHHVQLILAYNFWDWIDVMIKRVFGVLLVIVIIVVGYILINGFQWKTNQIAKYVQIVSGVLTILLLTIALVFGREIREAVRARHLDGVKYVKELIGTQEASNNRRWVYQELEEANRPLLPEDESRVLDICRDFDHIGYLCRKELIPVDLVVETYNRNILDMWNRLEEFINMWRQQRNDDDYFWEFQWLAEKASEKQTRIEKKKGGFWDKLAVWR